MNELFVLQAVANDVMMFIAINAATLKLIGELQSARRSPKIRRIFGWL